MLVTHLLPLAALLIWFLTILSLEFPHLSNVDIIHLLLHSFLLCSSTFFSVLIIAIAQINGICIILNLPTRLLMNLFFSLRQLENSGMESKCCGHPMLCSLSTMYTFLLGAIFIALSSSRILLVKYSANEGKLGLGICMEHFHPITHSFS